ncbi:cobalamin biosynthesis protein CobG, partial [Streptomyces sp. NPDC048551]
MLAAMPQPPSAVSRDEPVIRERGDACPGALRLHAADDGYLARVRIPGGLLDGAAALLLADAADRLGDGHIDLTSRGNAQLRGLGAGCGGELAAVLERAGLLPAPSHERVRNIVVSPLTGLDGSGRPDVSGWVAELDGLLCADPAAAGLSGRFLFALDDGRGDVAALAGDVVVGESTRLYSSHYR